MRALYEISQGPSQPLLDQQPIQSKAFTPENVDIFKFHGVPAPEFDPAAGSCSGSHYRLYKYFESAELPQELGRFKSIRWALRHGGYHTILTGVSIDGALFAITSAEEGCRGEIASWMNMTECVLKRKIEPRKV